MNTEKLDSLASSGTRNLHPERVAAELFHDSTFFDPNDLLQVRYEMVKAACHEPLAQVAADYGVSVPTCVRLKRAFRERGLQGLIPKPRGPREPHKIGEDIVRFVDRYRERHGRVGTRKLVPLIRDRFGVQISASGLDKALVRTKKKNPEPMKTDDLKRYLQWRECWSLGIVDRSTAILNRHGMARALRLTTPTPVAGTPVRDSTDRIVIQATAMLRHLLTIPPERRT